MNHIPTPDVIVCDHGTLNCCIVHSDVWPNDTCWTYQHPEYIEKSHR